MARTATTTRTGRGRPRTRTPLAEFNANVFAAREATGMSRKALWLKVANRLEDAEQRDQSYIGRLEHNMPEGLADTLFLSALAKACGVSLESISEWHAERAGRHRDVLDPTVPWQCAA